MPKVSVTIITLNEAAHIEAAIQSVAWADEIIVVDSGSSDATVSLARAKGARVSERAWTGWIDQKNHAAQLAAHDWILSLDADERVTPELAAEIRKALHRRNRAHRGYRIPRVAFHLGRWIRTTDFYPDYQTRLYDRRAARWRGRYVHESVLVDGGAGTLTHELQHYSFANLADHLDRLNRYSTLAAQQMFESGRRTNVGWPDRASGGRISPQLRAPARVPRRRRRPDSFARQRIRRVREDGEVVGAPARPVTLTLYT